jgi:hypothetical protein
MTREELNEFYEAVVCQDATVQRMINEKCEPEKIIVALYNEKKALTRRIVELEAIAPRKVVLPDGTIMIWQCPLEYLNVKLR